MHDQPKGVGDEDAPPTVAQDTQAEHVVLTFLLDEHPTQLTVPEVSRALNAVPGSFDSFDAVERAVVQLVGVGLLHCRDGFVLPTRVALYSARLLAA